MSAPLPGAIWITGLSGSGKSTLAREVTARMRHRGLTAAVIDGDAVRELMGHDLGHGLEDRLKNAWRIARLARFLALQSVPVVVATISLFREIHEWNRREIPGYFEVYLRADVDHLAQRDVQGLISRARRGEVRGVVGVDLPFDEPERPDLLIEVSEALRAEAMADRVLERFEARGRAT
jgi:adenylylsulfate kinase